MENVQTNTELEKKLIITKYPLKVKIANNYFKMI